jgi:FkbM family methyltransferase
MILDLSSCTSNDLSQSGELVTSQEGGSQPFDGIIEVLKQGLASLPDSHVIRQIIAHSPMMLKKIYLAFGELVFKSVPEFIMVEMVRKLAKQDSIIIEVGALTGASTEKFASFVGKGLVVAIEPNPLCISLLARRVKKLQNVRILNVAAGSRRGTGTLYVSGARGRGSSLIQQNAWNQSAVMIMTIDEIINILRLPKVDLIVIDVEGSEVDVLMGCSSALELCRYFIVEVHHFVSLTNEKEVNLILSSHGFQMVERRIDSVSPLITVDLYAKVYQDCKP